MAKEKDAPSGAPELDADHISESKRTEIEAAFSVDRDKPDVDVAMTDSDDEYTKSLKTDETVADAGDKADKTDKAEGATAAGAPGNPVARLFRGYWRRKRWTVPLTALVLLGILAAVPVTRYAAASQYIKKDVEITVVDDATKQPVSSATVKLDGHEQMTDAKGKTTIRAKVGDRAIAVSKKYYADTSSTVFVPIGKPRTSVEVAVKATGRQVPVTVVNKLSSKPLENVTLKAAGTEVKTDKDGKALIVLPADKPAQDVVLSDGRFNELKATLTVTGQSVPQNSFAMTPAGQIYFLSKLSGKIDVVKTDLDGANRKTVIAGTGREEERNTILLASRDWKHLALLSRRDSDKSKLYLIETGTDKMSVMDEGDASFGLIGWSGDTFVYSVGRNQPKEWQPNKYAIKSYSASTGKLATLDQSQAEGDQYNFKYQQLGNYYLLGNKLIYTADWNSSGYNGNVADKQDAIRSVNVSGTEKKDLKTFPADKYHSYNGRLYAADEVYFGTYSNETNKNEFYEYEGGAIKAATVDQDDFYNRAYPTYLLSPSGKATFWSEQRDGKETFFTGTQSGGEPKQVSVLAEHQAYGWFSDDYLLVSKKGSELYIMPVDGSKQTKVADYHKPNISFPGYGGGYGGL